MRIPDAAIPDGARSTSAWIPGRKIRSSVIGDHVGRERGNSRRVSSRRLYRVRQRCRGLAGHGAGAEFLDMVSRNAPKADGEQPFPVLREQDAAVAPAQRPGAKRTSRRDISVLHHDRPSGAAPGGGGGTRALALRWLGRLPFRSLRGTMRGWTALAGGRECTTPSCCFWRFPPRRNLKAIWRSRR